MTTDAQSSAQAVHEVIGIIYSPLSRRARIHGSGLEVFEIVRTWRAVEEDWQRLTEAYHWLTADQLNAALEFWRKNRQMVEARLVREQTSRVEQVWEEFPQSRPESR